VLNLHGFLPDQTRPIVTQMLTVLLSKSAVSSNFSSNYRNHVSCKNKNDRNFSYCDYSVISTYYWDL